MNARVLPIAALAGAILVLGLACGDDASGTTSSGSGSGSGGAGGAEDDGKFHPPTNGVALAEADACAKVQTAFQSAVTDLGCIATAPSCPGLIRAPSGAAECSSYDEGAAQGCADYVAQSADCDELKARIVDCVVAPIDGSAPGGCPS